MTEGQDEADPTLFRVKVEGIDKLVTVKICPDGIVPLASRAASVVLAVEADIYVVLKDGKAEAAVSREKLQSAVVAALSKGKLTWSL